MSICEVHRMHLSPRVNNQAFVSFGLVHYDVWGPYPIMSPTWFKYFVTFVDDFSSVTWLYLMKICCELFSHFSVFCTEIQTQFNFYIQTLRSVMPRNIVLEPF